MSQLAVSINYAKVLRIEATICNAVCNEIYENGGIFYASPTVKKDCPFILQKVTATSKITKVTAKVSFMEYNYSISGCKKDCGTRSLKISLIEKDRLLKDTPLQHCE